MNDQYYSNGKKVFVTGVACIARLLGLGLSKGVSLLGMSG